MFATWKDRDIVLKALSVAIGGLPLITPDDRANRDNLNRLFFALSFAPLQSNGGGIVAK